MQASEIRVSKDIIRALKKRASRAIRVLERRASKEIPVSEKKVFKAIQVSEKKASRENRPVSIRLASRENQKTAIRASNRKMRWKIKRISVKLKWSTRACRTPWSCLRSRSRKTQPLKTTSQFKCPLFKSRISQYSISPKRKRSVYKGVNSQPKRITFDIKQSRKA